MIKRTLARKTVVPLAASERIPKRALRGEGTCWAFSGEA